MNTTEFVEKQIKATGNTYIKGSLLKKKVPYSILQKEVKKGNLVKKTRYNAARKLAITYYTLPYIEKMEKSIARNVVKHLNEPNVCRNLSEEEINDFIDAFEKEQSEKLGFEMHLHEEQRLAVHMAVNQHMCIITGGPGTGKTSVINAIRYVENHRMDKEPEIIFTAPTGKAARRITESVGVPSKTVQKQIEANDYTDTPVCVTSYLMIVDEISMLDTITMYQLMRAVDGPMKLILVGDVDQLPSVGFGSILNDLIQSGVLPVTKLEKTFRQASDSCLAANIAYIRKGYAGLVKGDDFRIYTDFDESKIVQTLLDATLDARKRYGAENVILLTPYRRKGLTCANEMNKLLQEALNPSATCVDAIITDEDEEGEEYTLRVKFKVNDPVMQLRNRKDCPIANGDVGMVKEIYEDDSIFVDFGHYTKIYTKNELKELNLAYAMSVHKSQGSEYACVVTCVLPEHEQLLSRNMIFTDITRAKKEAIFYYNEESLKKALTVESAYIRDTFLCEELQYESKKYALIHSATAIA